MFWYKSKPLPAICVLACCLLLAACKPDAGTVDTGMKYFDINGYFTNDIARLNRIDNSVVKTVTHNGKSETKTVHISNWSSELGLFKDADINKPAWRDSYSIVKDSTFLLYKAKDADLKVREILIKRNKEKINWILIYTRVQNFLYKTTAKLSYYPDSLYVIEMDQRVKLIGLNTYKIKGVIR